MRYTKKEVTQITRIVMQICREKQSKRQGKRRDSSRNKKGLETRRMGNNKR